jgi:hypothetical protein
MRTHGHTTTWGTHIGVSRAKLGGGWYHEIKEWWATHQAARREARRAALNARWDATRERLKPLRAEAAADMVAAEHAFSTAITVYSLAL